MNIKKITVLDTIEQWLIHIGINQSFATWLKGVVAIVFLALVSYILLYFTRKIVIKIILKITRKSENKFDDLLVKNRVFHRLALLVPAFFIYGMIPVFLEDFPWWITFLQKILGICMVILFLLVTGNFLESLCTFYENKAQSRTRSLRQYMQLIKIFLWSAGIIIIISKIFNVATASFLGGLGAFTAVLLLVFKDPLMGLTASVQISSQDLVRLGDWVTLPKYNVDGEVKEINLVTVKVENFDKTTVSIPAYTFISDSFQNWRGMEESGVRRIKRSILIDMKSVKYCTDEMLVKYEKIQLIKEYIQKKQVEVEEYNKIHNVDETLPINGKRQTNLGIFRKYLIEYLMNSPVIDTTKTLLVRHLEATEKGIPIEIYVFSKLQKWELYENVQADIFDHVIAAVSLFDLQVFQNPTGADFKAMVSK